MSIIVRREAALADSGLPECGWLVEHLDPSRSQAATATELSRSLWAHRRSCDICKAREQYADTRAEPVPDRGFHSSRVMRVLTFIDDVIATITWLVLLVVAVTTDLWREPLLWVVLALPLLVWGYFRRWRR